MKVEIIWSIGEHKKGEVKDVPESEGHVLIGTGCANAVELEKPKGPAAMQEKPDKKGK
jgi:hypothetical protein